MSITEKYNFKVSVNQFHHPVAFNFWDQTEQILIDIFEEKCLQLKKLNKSHYTMVELGSNQSYYSLLFKHILGKDITTNVMVEPFKQGHLVGQDQFKLNNVDGIFYNRSIGTRWEAVNQNFDVNPITLEEILMEQNIQSFDVVQCDIDGSEIHMLELNAEFFINKKTEFLFLGTHSEEKHNACKSILQNAGYNILVDHPEFNIGYDSLIVAQSS